jgi:hypothetical protein
VTKIGGANLGSTSININNGFYSIYSTGSNVLLTQFGGGNPYYYYYYYYYSSSFLRISASYNGLGVLVFTVLIDEVPNGAVVSAGTVATLTLRPPSTSILTNTWGTPTITSSITSS